VNEPLPLLLLHPAATVSAVWRPLRRAWERRWQVIAPDLLPAGDPGTQLRRWAELAAAEILAACGGPAHVVGVSLGASVALRLALDHPSLVASLILDSAQLGGLPLPVAQRAVGRLGARWGLSCP
jgi:pimeloyl-ACP methyl ester carboxylesterase